MLKLHPPHLAAIRAHAESTYPEECCGIMLGQLSDEGKILVEVLATQNVWSAETTESFPDELGKNKMNRYTIAPAFLLQTQREARDRHLNIIGIYHSHTDTSAIPSEFDRVCAWHQYSYIIVSVQNGKACDLLCWSLDDENRFQPEEMIIV